MGKLNLINRVYLKECLSFKEVDLEFKKGLNIFTGPSGAGKSILMQAILSLFALADVKAKMIHRIQRDYFEVLNEKLRWGN